VWGDVPAGTTAVQVVQGLLDSVENEWERTAKLASRWALPAWQQDVWW